MTTNGIVLSTTDEDSQCIWWRIRTRLERCLLCSWSLVSLLFFGLIISVITLATISYNSNSKVCLTHQCLIEASRIMKFVNESWSPCHHFYQFACGKWLNSTIIDDQSNSVSSFSISQDRVDHRLRFLLEEPILSFESQTVQNMKNLFNSCMNLSLIDEIGSKPIIRYIGRLGGWPVVEGQQWSDSNFDFIDFVSKIRNYGFKHDFFFRVNVAHNFKQNTAFNIYIREPTFSCLSKEELINQNSYRMEEYLVFMVDIATLLGVDEDKAREELREVIRLESTIAKSSRDSSGYEFVSIRRLNELTRNRWTELINSYLSLDFEINENETLITSSIQTIRSLNRILKEYSETNKRVLANYMIWKIIFQSIKALDKGFQEVFDDFYLRTRILKRNTKRWKTCLSLVSDNFRTGLTSLYLIKDEYKQLKKSSATEMVDNIRNNLINKFGEYDWLDDDTRYLAINKLKLINRFIGYSDQLLDSNKIDEEYDSMEGLRANDFFGNLLKVQKWNSDNEYSKLRTFNDRNDWHNILTTTQINAYYSPHINSIKIPVWILQSGIFFNHKRPKYLNYGSLGWIIGHELIHPFDTIGGRFDKRGNLRDWWDIETKTLFVNKSKCFVRQYPKYTANDVKEKTRLSENIADNGGIDIAFRSYKEYVRQNGEEYSLPALDYTSDQLFWISAAQTWCSKHTTNALKYFLRNSVHSLSEHRVDISFANSDQFSDVWKCSKSDRMSAANKCKIW